MTTDMYQADLLIENGAAVICSKCLNRDAISCYKYTCPGCSKVICNHRLKNQATRGILEHTVLYIGDYAFVSCDRRVSSDE